MTTPMKIGFAGPSESMTTEQQRELLRFLVAIGGTELHHGTGQADKEARAIAKRLGLRVVEHPPLPHAAPVMQPRRAIVDSTDLLVSTITSFEENGRGNGTGAAKRFAEKVGKPIHLIWPDGSCQNM